MLLFFSAHVFLPLGLLSTPSVCFGQTFIMEQQSGNSQGVVSRDISISDPWSGAYLNEKVTVVGRAEINDSFSMNNLWPAQGRENDFNLDNVFGNEDININNFNEPDHSNNGSDRLFNQQSISGSEQGTDIYKAQEIIINNEQRAETFFEQSAPNKYSWLDLF